MSGNYTKLTTEPLLDDDAILIEPDVPSQPRLPEPEAPTLAKAEPQPVSSTPLFNMSSFIKPHIPGMDDIHTRERPFSGGNTLDESVWATLHRDLSNIGDKLLSILWPLRLKKSLSQAQIISRRFMGGQNDIEDAVGTSNEGEDDYSDETLKKIRDWDLWGPLVINLGFSVIITYLQNKSLNENDEETASEIFSGAFTLIWSSLAVLSINIQLLSPVQQKLENGTISNGIIGISFFQCLSLLSYSFFPVVLGGLISIFVHFKLIRIIISFVMLSWSLLCTFLLLGIVTNCKKRGTLSFTDDSIGDEGNESDKRIFLMIYPVFLIFGLFSWFCVIV